MGMVQAYLGNRAPTESQEEINGHFGSNDFLPWEKPKFPMPETVWDEMSILLAMMEKAGLLKRSAKPIAMHLAMRLWMGEKLKVCPLVVREKEIDPNSTEIALLLQHLPKELQEHARREGKKTVKLDQRPLFPWGNEFPKGEELWKTEKEKLALLQEAYYKAVQTISFLQD